MKKEGLIQLINQASHIERLRVMQQIDKEEKILKENESIISDSQDVMYVNGILKVRRNPLSVGWNKIKYIPSTEEGCLHCGKRFFSVHLPDLVEVEDGHYHCNCYMIKDIDEKKDILKEIIIEKMANVLVRRGVDFSIKEYILHSITFDVKTSICNMEISVRDDGNDIALKIFKNETIKDRHFEKVFNITVNDEYALGKYTSYKQFADAIKAFSTAFMNKSLY